MKKIIIQSIFLLIDGLLAALPAVLSGQVVIGGTTPDVSAALDIQGSLGVLLPRLATAERDAISNPATGLMLFNMTTTCLEINTGTSADPVWSRVTCRTGTATGLDCVAVTVTGTLSTGQVSSGVTFSVPYSGGNGGVYVAQTVNSSGVTGLTAVLPTGNFTENPGELLFAVSGTPASDGNASFALSVGGQQCTVNIPVLIVGSVTALDCNGAVVTGTLGSGQSASGVSASVPYTGGNGGQHSGQTVSSTGVTGLDATLATGSFASGFGNLTYNITGTPASAGTAVFALNIGGQTCTLNVTVNVPGSISMLDCSGAVVTGTLGSGQNASGVSASVPYTGGNGGQHSGQTVSSTGVTGLDATLATGSFASGFGNLTYSITGTPASAGTALFALNIGGHTCTLSVTASSGPACRAKVDATNYKTFLCYNLGAANTSADPFTPSWEINGGYWQWGRLAEAASGPTGSGADQAKETAVSGWITSKAPNGSWTDGSKTVNDPCPAGYRVPTKTQWEVVVANNTLTYTGTWSTSPVNYSPGLFIGNDLMLPAAGARNTLSGGLVYRGSRGYYSTSTEYGSANCWNPYFDNTTIYTNSSSFSRSAAASVRCIEE